MFCAKKRKTMSELCSPITCFLALTGLLSIVMVVRKKGKTAKQAMAKAGCRCTKAMEDAAAEILGGEDGTEGCD